MAEKNDKVCSTDRMELFYSKVRSKQKEIVKFKGGHVLLAGEHSDEIVRNQIEWIEKYAL